MALHLITGYAGEEHITSNDQGAYNAATFGDGQFVLDRGEKFAYTIASNNSIQIADGEAMMKGRFIKMPSGTTETVIIENGTQGMKRRDLICIRYEKNPSNSIESARLVVIKGTESADAPVDPEYTDGNITDGTDTVNDMPLYRVNLDGINISSVVLRASVKESMVKYMEEYQLPIATTSKLGGVKAGTDVSVNTVTGVMSIPALFPTGSVTKPVFVNSSRKLEAGYTLDFGKPHVTLTNVSVPVNGMISYEVTLPYYSNQWTKVLFVNAQLSYNNPLVFIDGVNFTDNPSQQNYKVSFFLKNTSNQAWTISSMEFPTLAYKK